MGASVFTEKIKSYLNLNKQLKSKIYFDDETNLTEYEAEMRSVDLRSIDLALRLYKLSTLAVDIIIYLHTHEGVFNGGYTDLTIALDRITGPKGQESNIRKMCLNLAENNIIYIDYVKGKHKVSAIRLNPKWTALI
jgi:hypothetical protein